jgi:hypothetical protein
MRAAGGGGLQEDGESATPKKVTYFAIVEDSPVLMHISARQNRRTGRSAIHQASESPIMSAVIYKVDKKSGPSGVWTSCHAKAFNVMS